MLSQVSEHAAVNDFSNIFQSAYKLLHITQIALLRVQNDILRAVDDGKYVLVVLLDVPTVFNTLIHTVLLLHLDIYLGIAGNVMS